MYTRSPYLKVTGFRFSHSTSVATLFGIIFIIFISSYAFAGPPTQFLQTKITAIRALIAKPTPNTKVKAQIDQELLSVIKPLMNFPKMSAKTLGKRWPTFNADQQKRFINLFQDLVFYSYMKRIRSANEDYKLIYEDEEAQPKGALVSAVAETKKGSFELGFSLEELPTKNSFEVTDVIIDEVSLVENYNEQFIKIIKKSGFDALLKKMNDQLQKVK